MALTAAEAAFTFCIVMAVAEVARGGSGAPWTTICAIFGGTYLIALAIFRR